MQEQLENEISDDHLAFAAGMPPSWKTETLTLYTGDALEVLRRLPGDIADCVVTSPPYWGLRDYGYSAWTGGSELCRHSTGRGSNRPQAKHPGLGSYPASPPHRGGRSDICARCGARRTGGQYGLEATPQAYVNRLRAVFRELRRVLKPAGTVWLNLGDTYSSTPGGAAGMAAQASGLPPAKNLIGLPWRVALALQSDGWYLRNSVVWAKKNPMPESVRDRLSATHEFVFLLTPSPRYYFNLDAIRAPLARPEALGEGIAMGSGAHVEAALGTSARRKGGSIYGISRSAERFFAGHVPGRGVRRRGSRHDQAHPRGKNPGDVWRIATRPLRTEQHCAAFPVDIPLRCILAGCPERGLVLDPFSGAGTTGLAACQLGRRYIGVELYERYNKIAQERISRFQRAGHDMQGGSPGREPLPVNGEELR